MDIKVAGINAMILQEALEQARKGRMHILGIMEQALAKPREEMSPVCTADHHAQDTSGQDP
jgi:polyribonucleotide nucleotidyltransferase